MAIDLLFAREYPHFLDRPLIRFYGWETPTISLGYSQDVNEINREKVATNQIAFVRRPTGGRAIYHHEELTYSIIIPIGLMRREDLYLYINQWFGKLLEMYEITCSLQKEQPDFREYYKKDQSALCFSSAARYELKVNDKKILGSAQRVMTDAILQHGSFMIGDTHMNLIKYLNIDDRKKNEIFIKMEKMSTNVEKHTSVKRNSYSIAEDFIKILEQDGVSFVDFKESSSVRDAAKKYYDELIIQ